MLAGAHLHRFKEKKKRKRLLHCPAWVCDPSIYSRERMKERNIFQRFEFLLPLSQSHQWWAEEDWGESSRLAGWREHTHMLLSCSLLIRINGSHDTVVLLRLIQPLWVPLNVLPSPLPLPPLSFSFFYIKRKACVSENSGQFSFKVSQHVCGFPRPSIVWCFFFCLFVLTSMAKCLLHYTGFFTHFFLKLRALMSTYVEWSCSWFTLCQKCPTFRPFIC